MRRRRRRSNNDLLVASEQAIHEHDPAWLSILVGDN